MQLCDRWENTLNVAIAATRLKAKLLKPKDKEPAPEGPWGSGRINKNPSPPLRRPSHPAKPAKGPDPSVFN